MIEIKVATILLRKKNEEFIMLGENTFIITRLINKKKTITEFAILQMMIFRNIP